MENSEKRTKGFLWMAIAATVQAIFFIIIASTTFWITVSVLLTLGAWYLYFIMRFNWEYLLDHEEFTMAGFCHVLENNHSLARHLDPGTTVNGVKVLFDTWKTPRTTKYFGRWTVFTDPNTGVRLFRDNSKFVNCWYMM